MKPKMSIVLCLFTCLFLIFSCQKQDEGLRGQSKAFVVSDKMLANWGVLAVVIKEPDASILSSIEHDTAGEVKELEEWQKVQRMRICHTLFIPLDDSVELIAAEVAAIGGGESEGGGLVHGKVLYQGKKALLFNAVVGYGIPEFMVYAVSGKKRSEAYYMQADSGMNTKSRPVEYLLTSM